MAKSLIGQDIRDWSEPLKNKKREKFCQEYVRLEMVQKLPYEKEKEWKLIMLALITMETMLSFYPESL